MDDFRAPVDINMLLSGNFAELRGSHFHAGIDIKTQGRTGFNVYSIEDGYVSRIKVSPYGYGHALYITHPNGYTSVYAHLDKFNIQIEQYVREQQYRQRSFAVDLFPDVDFINIEKGNVIGLSGNSGGSMGPHLHFEIRKTASEKPQNPLLWKLNITDNIAPRFHRLYLYPLSQRGTILGKQTRQSFELSKNGNLYSVKNKDVIEVADTIGFAAHVNDYLNGSYNRCGVYNLIVKANKEKIYELKLDEVSFSESRYIVSHMDYALNLNTHVKVHKCFIDDGNKFSGYKIKKNNGKLYVAPDSIVNIELIAFDVYGNKSELSFTVRGVNALSKAPTPTAAKILYPGQINHFEQNDIVIDFPVDALYSKLYFNYEEFPNTGAYYSNIHKIHDINDPLHKHYNVKIKTNVPNRALYKKLYIGKIASNGSTRVATSNVRMDDDWLYTRIREFGTFAVMADTTSPEIIPQNIEENKDMNTETSIRIKINDSETGIKSYDGYINGNWVLFQYDAKNDLLQYDFDDKMPEGDSFELKLIITDTKQNTTAKTVNFRKSAATSKK